MRKNCTDSNNKLFSILTATVLLFAFIGSTTVFAEGLPKADKNGNYSENCTHRYWKVADPDPAGLNGRLSKDLAAIWYSPDNNWPDFDFFKWPVIRRFKTGTILIGNGEPDSFVMSKDSKGDPWLCVNIGDMDTEAICFVRANKKFIVPVPSANADAPYTYPLAVPNVSEGLTSILSEADGRSSIIAKIGKNERFLIISDEDEYVKILAPTGKVGYLHSSKVRTIGKRAIGGARAILKTSSISLWQSKKGNKASGTLYNREAVYLLKPGRMPLVMTGTGKVGYVWSKYLMWLPLDFKN